MKGSTSKIDLANETIEGVSHSFDSLADEIAKMIGYPITIEDRFHHLISYSKHQGDIDEARIATIIKKKAPDKVVNSLWKTGFMKEILEKDEPVMVPAVDKVGLGNRLVISMKHNSRMVGFIWVHVGDKMLDSHQLQLLKKSANLVKYQLLHYQTKATQEEQRKEFFLHLLNEYPQLEESISTRATRLNIPLDQEYTIVIIDFFKEIDQKMEKYIYNWSKNIYLLQIVSFIFDKNQIIFLIGQKDTKEIQKNISFFIKNFIKGMSQRLQLKDVAGAFGMTYKSLSNMKDSYEQALKVLELKKRFPKDLFSAYGYHELGIYQFIDEIYENRVRTHYRNETIQRLKEYDSHHNTDLLSTLETYLDYDCNGQKASEQIHIHPNTLNYRLKRILEIGQIDLNNFNQKITLYMDLKLEGRKEENK